MRPAYARRLSLALAVLAAVLFVPPHAARASDHADTPQLVSIGRHDARITDLFAFTSGDRLVLILNTNPAIPGSVVEYAWSADLKIQIAIDNDSPVSFSDANANATFGGTIVNPAGIEEDITFDIDVFKGAPRLKVKGIRGDYKKDIRFFAGLRDDPFIRGPQIGKNVAAMVIDLPLAAVIDDSSTLLLWGTSRVDDIVQTAEFVGRSLRSQLPAFLALNDFHPSQHQSELGLAPDVIIYDTNLPALFPNGRLLTDDVIDLVGVPAILASDAPFPSANDVPFLAGFPYLAPPHLP
ncbi:MAG TPA: hypothetical protein VF789_06215 [Thermoanaerobaculia bacterium]